MTTTLYVDQWEGPSSWKQIRREVTVGQIVSMATQALSDMQSILLTNLEAIAAHNKGDKSGSIVMPEDAEGLSILFGAHRRRVILKRISAHDYNDSMGQVSAFMADLRKTIAKQEDFLDELAAKGTCSTAFIDDASNMLSSSRIFSGKMCEDCGDVVSSKTYSEHRMSLRCMTATTNRDVRESGHVEMSEGWQISAIKKSGVGFEIRPSGYTIWAPPWVAQAIQSYNKDNGGFGGLSLSEYLAKMKPE